MRFQERIQKFPTIKQQKRPADQVHRECCEGGGVSRPRIVKTNEATGIDKIARVRNFATAF
jgi:hypothetical protein